MTHNRIAVLVLAGSGALAVLAQSVGAPEFDAVSIKPSVQNKNGPMQFEPGRAYSNSVTAHRIIMAAYHLKEYQLVGVSGWVGTDWFALEAKADKPVDESQLRLMLQTLLAKRFRLVVHRATRETPVYVLMASKRTRLSASKPGVAIPAGQTTETMESLVSLLNLQGFQKIAGIDRPVLDETGLRGEYLVSKSWYDSWEDFGTSIIEDKMGLKLESRKVPMDVLVIDRIEKPDPN